MIQILPCFIHFIIYLNKRVYRVFIISYISTMPLIIYVFFEKFLNFEFLLEFEIFLKIFEILWNWKILKFCAMFYTLYHIFKQESIQGRGMIKGRHLALYQISKTTVFTRDGNEYTVGVLDQTSDYRIPKSVFGYSENFFLWK
jgi:hypothetical protein